MIFVASFSEPCRRARGIILPKRPVVLMTTRNSVMEVFVLFRLFLETSLFLAVICIFRHLPSAMCATQVWSYRCVLSVAKEVRLRAGAGAGTVGSPG